MSKGFFVSFESVDGLGKTTQVNQLAKALLDAGHDVHVTKEPGDKFCGSNVGPGVRDMIFHSVRTQNMRPGVADLMFLADHVQNAGDIAELVDAGKVVISDRYADSQWAYNASGVKGAPAWVMKCFGEQFGIVPDMTVLLRARGTSVITRKKCYEDISWALQRANARKGAEAGKQDGKLWNDVESQRRIQDAYLFYLAGQERTFIVDVYEQSTIGEIHQTILVEVLRRLAQPSVSQSQMRLPYFDDQAYKGCIQ